MKVCKILLILAIAIAPFFFYAPTSVVNEIAEASPRSSGKTPKAPKAPKTSKAPKASPRAPKVPKAPKAPSIQQRAPAKAPSVQRQAPAQGRSIQKQAPAKAPSIQKQTPAQGRSPRQAQPQLNRQAATPQARSAPAIPARNYSRTPSMSRIDPVNRSNIRRPLSNPVPVPSRIVTPRSPVNAPSVRGDLPGSGRETRDRVNTFLRQEKSRPVARPKDQRDQKNKDRGWITKQRENNKHSVKRVRDRVRHNHPYHRDWFNDRFFSKHRYRPRYYNPRANWWAPTSWVVINNWLSEQWGVPIYYDDIGYPVEILPEVELPPQQDVYIPQQDAEWLPLGIFAAGKSIDESSYSNMYVQLAIGRNGEVAGSYYNASTDQLHPLQGLVVVETQEIVWTVTDNPRSPLMTTGIYDFTLDVVPVLVYFPEGTTQSWVLVRLDQD